MLRLPSVTTSVQPRKSFFTDETRGAALSPLRKIYCASETIFPTARSLPPVAAGFPIPPPLQ